MASWRLSSVTAGKTVRRWRSRNVTTLPTGICCPGKRVSISCSSIVAEAVPPGGRGRGFAPRGETACSGRTGGQCNGGCGGPVLDAEVAYLGLFVEVVVRRLGSQDGGVITTRPDEAPAGGGVAVCRLDATRRAGRRRRRSACRPGWWAGGRGGPRLRAGGSRSRSRCRAARRSQGWRGEREVASRRDAGVRGRSSGDAGVLAAVSEHCGSSLARNLTSAGRDRRCPREAGRPAGRRRAHRCQPRARRASR